MHIQLGTECKLSRVWNLQTIWKFKGQCKVLEYAFAFTAKNLIIMRKIERARADAADEVKSGWTFSWQAKKVINFSTLKYKTLIKHIHFSSVWFAFAETYEANVGIKMWTQKKKKLTVCWYLLRYRIEQQITVSSVNAINKFAILIHMVLFTCVNCLDWTWRACSSAKISGCKWVYESLVIYTCHQMCCFCCFTLSFGLLLFL